MPARHLCMFESPVASMSAQYSFRSKYRRPNFQGCMTMLIHEHHVTAMNTENTFHEGHNQPSTHSRHICIRIWANAHDCCLQLSMLLLPSQRLAGRDCEERS